MQCKDVMTRDVQWVPPDEMVSDAAKLMTVHNLGFLPVCKPDGLPIGVITDRDIALRVVGENRFAAVTKVREVMSLPVQFVRPDTSMDRLREIMTNEGVSRLVVVDDGGYLVGVVSLNDMLVHASGHLSLDTVRGLYARQTRGDSTHPSRVPPACKPEPVQEVFPLASAPSSEPEKATLGQPESETTAHGGTKRLKEVPV